MNLLLKRIRSIYAYYERKQAQKQDGFSAVFLYFPNRTKKNLALHQARLKNRENYSMNRTATALPSTRTMRVSSSPPMSMGE